MKIPWQWITFLALMTVTSAPAQDTKQPNFLFILADDLGCRDLSMEGSLFYESPNIDRIARSGMRFSQGYAACQVCSPSRASIMTGKTPARHGITDWIGAASGLRWNRNDRVLPSEYVHNLPAEDTTIAEALRDAGYKTFFAGKWHLGSEGSWPEDHGFDINKGGWNVGSPGGGYFSPWENPRLDSATHGESLPIRLGNETAKFIDDHKEQPFFAFLSFYSVHGPLQTTNDLWKKYRQKALKSDFRSRFVIDRTMPVRQHQDHPVYGGMVEAMDSAVGIVLKKLDALGLADNTAVIFTSDNGGVSSGDGFSTSNLPFRGGKGRQWEGGIREPYYVSVPGVTKPETVCDVPVIGMDFYPTILELAGLSQKPKQHVDGVSLVPLLKGESMPDRDLFWHYPHYGNQGGEPSSIIRSGDWKLIHYFEDGRDELYNLANDLGEKNDVIAREKEKASALRKKLDSWLADTGARIPQPDKRFDPERKERQRINVREKTLPTLEKRHADVLKPDWIPNPTWWGSQDNS